MLGRIKYKLLRLLLDDICLRSECESCLLSRATEVKGLENAVWFECLEGDIFKRARQVWGLENKED